MHSSFVEDELLPADVLQDLASMKQDASLLRQERLDELSRLLVSKRTDAINERKASGIEDIWHAAEEAYIGIDDANRGEFANAKWAKPMTMDAPLTHERRPEDTSDVRSTVFVRITARYVDAGAAKLAEILLPPDDKPFSLEPTPVPDLISALEDDAPVLGPDGIPLQRDPTPEEQARMQPSGAPPDATAPQTAVPASPTPVSPGVPAGPPPPPGTPAPADSPGVPLLVKDLAKEAMDKAKDCAAKAEKRIHDDMVEGNYTGEVRKIIFDAAKLGVGVLKGPFPTRVKSMAVKKSPEGFQLIVQYAIKATQKRIDPWNLYPDPACGENIQDGDYIFEKSRLSPRQLRKLKHEPGYDKHQIERVLQEGPQRRVLEAEKTTDPRTLKDTAFDAWHYYGVLSREDLLLLNPDEKIDPDKPEIFAQVTLVNDTAIRAVVNPLDSGMFPYHAMPWQRRDGHWAGVGVAEQVSVPQRMLNSATRALLDNAGVSSGLQIIMDRTSVEPADGDWGITRNKIWFKNEGGMNDDVRKALTAITFPNIGEALHALIEYTLRLAEESTNIPLITQGQSGDTTPETLGATQLQNNNANQLLRGIAYNFDDFITEPYMTARYEWHLLDPDLPDTEKGDFKINAHGSTALVERAIQDQTIAQMAGVVKDPAFGINPRKWMREYLQSKRLDARRFQYSEEEQKKIDSTPAPPPPQVQAAQVRAEVDKLKLELQERIAMTEATLKQALAKIDTDRDTVYVQAEAERTKNEHEGRMREMQMKLQIAMLDYANKRGIALDQVKSDLAQTAMKLKVQQELAAADRAAEALKPPTEPPGRAKPGQSYQS